MARIPAANRAPQPTATRRPRPQTPTPSGNSGLPTRRASAQTSPTENAGRRAVGRNVVRMRDGHPFLAHASPSSSCGPVALRQSAVRGKGVPAKRLWMVLRFALRPDCIARHPGVPVVRRNIHREIAPDLHSLHSDLTGVLSTLANWTARGVRRQQARCEKWKGGQRKCKAGIDTSGSQVASSQERDVHPRGASRTTLRSFG